MKQNPETTMKIFETYEDKKYATDEAWDNDGGIDNARLKNGDRVRLLYSTVGDPPRGCRGFGVIVPAGSEGVVSYARTARVSRKRNHDREYFANVDVDTELGSSRVRVPHNALKVVKRAEPKMLERTTKIRHRRRWCSKHDR